MRLLVYPDSLVSVNEILNPISVSVYPNPVGEGTAIHIDMKNREDQYTAQLTGIDGKIYFVSSGPIETLENRLSQQFSELPSGFYILSLDNKKDPISRTKILKQNQ